jgi:glyoxylate/hydroxypyruvate reductase A
MTVNVLFAAKSDQWPIYKDAIYQAFAARNIAANLAPDLPADQVDYVIYAPNSGLSDFGQFPRLRAVFSLWAGVETIVGNKTLTVPLTRMVDHGLRQGMVEWVTGHALRHHLGMDQHITTQDGKWQQDVPPLAPDRRISVLGLGELGTACAQSLSHIGFNVTGWSRTPRDVAGVRCLSGTAGLMSSLSNAEIVVLLLPNTPQTENTLDADTIPLLARGCVVINPGRGVLIDDDALLAALDTGHIGHATLDVFRVEPLPVDHPFWAHPNVTVTPHIAADTRPQTAAQVIADNLNRAMAGQPLQFLVDRTRGY